MQNTKTSQQEKFDEKKQAIFVANKYLDHPFLDPDGDECTLARQFLRAIEREEKNNMAMQSLKSHV